MILKINPLFPTLSLTKNKYENSETNIKQTVITLVNTIFQIQYVSFKSVATIISAIPMTTMVSNCTQQASYISTLLKYNERQLSEIQYRETAAAAIFPANSKINTLYFIVHFHSHFLIKAIVCDNLLI